MKRTERAALWRLFAGSTRTLRLSVALSVVQAAALLPVALLVRRAFDTILPRHEVGPLVLCGAEILVLYLASAALNLLTSYVVLRATKASITRLRGELMERLYALPQAYFDRTSGAALHAVVVQDTERLDVMANGVVGNLMPAVVVALALSVALAVLYLELFLVLLLVLPALIVLGRLLGAQVRGRTHDWTQAFDVFSVRTHLALRSMTLTKALEVRGEELARRRAEHEALGRAGLRMAWRQSAYTASQGAIGAAAGVLVLVLGGAAVARGTMSVGELLSFYALLGLMLRQLNVIVIAIPVVLAGLESVRRLDFILGAADEQPYSGAAAVAFDGSIELEDVSFGYGPRRVLEGVSLRIEAGRQLAIVGPNGAGKTTLVRLILGLYRPQQGCLRAAGVPYEELDLGRLRRAVGLAMQDPVIFLGSVADNIRAGRAGLSDADVREAARRATADVFIEALPLGYDTEVGDEGALLSGGQRQRLAIARALVNRPRLLILDEPTTHLDQTAITTVLGNLRSLPGAPSVLLITHDAEVAGLSDAVVTLRSGRLVEHRARARLPAGA